MKNKRLFKSLKNGVYNTLYYRVDGDVIYTVHLAYKNEMFTVHYYLFEGNDVYDEENYEGEHVIEIREFDDFLSLVKERFPGMIENWNG